MNASLETVFAEAAGAWPAELQRHLSASQINMFRRCADQYRRRYVRGEKIRPAGAMLWGTADHEAHAVNFTQKIDTHQDITSGDVQLAFAEALDQAIERDGGVNEIDWADSEKPGDVKDRGAKLVKVYHEQVSPTIQPVAVEERIEITMPGVPVPIVGYVDLRDARRGFDRKTSGRKPSSLSDEWVVQGLIYQAALRQPVDWHVSVKTKLPAVYTPTELGFLQQPFTDLSVKRAELYARVTAAEILSCYLRYGPDEPWPDGQGHKWACGLCGFRDTCPWWLS